MKTTMQRFLLAMLFLMSSCLCSVASAKAAEQVTSVVASTSENSRSDPLLDDLEQRTFQFFWDTANPKNGLMPDRYPTKSFASIAAVGFELTADIVGAERGYVTRAQARERVLSALKFFDNAKQGSQAKHVTGYHGFFYHFLDMQSGERLGDTELSSVDTALLLAGMLACESYFDHPDEQEVTRLVERIYRRVDWRWLQPRVPLIAHGWKPEEGFLKYDWRGYNEAMLVYILAFGSPTHAVDSQAWQAWTDTYTKSWGIWYGQEHLGFGPQFAHQYSQVWIDYRGIRDAFMRDHHLDYFENSRRATYAQQAYARDNPHHWRDYSSTVWGLTACDGPANVTLDSDGQQRKFFGYAARGAPAFPSFDDGTLAPTAVAASLPFAPEIVLPTLRTLRERYGKVIYGRYGFIDSFNPSFNSNVPLSYGHIVTSFGWVDNDYLGIDQGPIVAMLENYRSDLLWKIMRKNPHIRAGLKRAGFTGGWLDQ